MTAALWIFTSFLVVVITLTVMGAALRPYVADLVKERNEWQLRAQSAEAEIEAHIATDVRLLEPIDADATLDVFLKGMTTDDGQ